MTNRDSDRPVDKLLASLQERAKELNCLYEVEQILARLDLPLDDAFRQVVEVIPPGWQYPDVCRAMIEYDERVFSQEEVRPTPWVQSSDIVVQGAVVGRLSVWYTEGAPAGGHRSVPQRGGTADPDHRRASRPEHSLSPDVRDPAEMGGGQPRTRSREGGPLAGPDRPAPALRPRALPADRPQDGQPPVLGRYRRRTGAAPGDLRSSRGGPPPRCELPRPPALGQRTGPALRQTVRARAAVPRRRRGDLADPGLGDGGQGQLPARGPQQPPFLSVRGGRGGAALPPPPGRRYRAVQGHHRRHPRRSHPALSHRSVEFHLGRQEVHPDRATSSTSSTGSSSPTPATASSAARAPGSFWPRPSCAGTVGGPADRRGQGPAQLVRRFRRPHELHRAQRPRRGAAAEVPRDLPGPSGVPEHHPAVQELPVPARDRQGRVDDPRRGRRHALSSSVRRAFSKTGWDRRFPASTAVSSSPTRAPRTSACGPSSTP